MQCAPPARCVIQFGAGLQKVRCGIQFALGGSWGYSPAKCEVATRCKGIQRPRNEKLNIYSREKIQRQTEILS